MIRLMLLRLAYLGITNAVALLRLLPGGDRDKDIEILSLRHQLAVLQRQLDGQRVRFEPVDRAWLAALTPSLMRRRRVGWPTRRQANGLRLSMSWLVSMRMDSSWGWSSRCASSMIRTGMRPRSACSVARASAAWGRRVAWWTRGCPPRDSTIWWWMPR